MDAPVPQRPDTAADQAREGDRTRGLILETCYRHPDVSTGVHCTRCGRPICPDCMQEAPVGYQCPTCVAEARRSGPRTRITIGSPRSIAMTLIGVNVAVFVLQMVLRGRDLGGMAPMWMAATGEYWRLLTAMFLHADVIHILFNMYALYLFGQLVEGTLGKLRFLAIYLVSGFLASVTSFMFSNPMILSVGASGAIAGLVGAWIAYNLRRRGTTFASANLQWALTLIAINAVLGFAIPRIDNWAHLGGLVSGVAAGWIAEGFGPRTTRTLTTVLGFVGMIALGVALAAFRAGQLLPP